VAPGIRVAAPDGGSLLSRTLSHELAQGGGVGDPFVSPIIRHKGVGDPCVGYNGGLAGYQAVRVWFVTHPG
jgi:hypothetical protein